MGCVSNGTVVAKEVGKGFLQTYRAVVICGKKCWAFNAEFSVSRIGRREGGVNLSPVSRRTNSSGHYNRASQQSRQRFLTAEGKNRKMDTNNTLETH